jgi:ribosomal protein L18
VQQAMLRVQSAMALAQGLEGLEDAGRAFKQLGVTVTSFGTKALSAFQAMSTASKAFLVTGIGLLIAGLGTAIAYWDDISKAIGLASDEQDTYAKQQKRINEQAKESRESVAKESASFATLISRLKATNEGSKERDGLIKQINKEYGTTLKNIKDETKFQEQLNNELASYLEYQKAKFQLQKNEEKIVKNLEVQDRLSNSIKDQKERVKLAEKINDLQTKYNEAEDKKNQGGKFELKTEKERLKLQTEVNKIATQIIENEKKNERAGIKITSLEQEKFALSNLNKELENAEKRFEDYGRSANEASAKVDELTNSGSKYVENNKEVKTSTIDTNKELANTLESLTEKNKQFGLSEQELLLLSKLKTDALIQEQFLKSTDKDKEKQRTDALLANETDYNNQVNALRKKEVSDLETLKTTSAKDGIAQLVATRTTELEVEKNTAEKKLAIEKSLQEHKAELRQKDFDLALQGIGVIKSIFEKSKGVQKAAVIAESAIGIAKIITSTQAANAAAIAKYSAIPGGQAFSAAEIARNKIGAGIGIAANITATAKALQALGGGSAPSGGGDLGGGGGGVIAPNLNVVGDTGINQLATLQQQPIKAYVVSNDITSAQQFDLKVQQTASL